MGGSCDIWATTFDMESGQAKSCKKRGRVTSLPLKGEGQAEEVSEKAGNHQESNWLKVASYQSAPIKP